MATHNELGKNGEELAVTFLTEKGYAILAKNYRHLKAEIDIIAQKEGVLAIIEVKTRSTEAIGKPQDAVSKKQIKNLLNAADFYANHYSLDLEIRCDIIAILKNNSGTKIEHLENAFYHF